MLSYKTIFIFVAKCLVIYFVLVLLLAPALRLDQVFSAFMCGTANTVFPNTTWYNAVEGKEQVIKANIKYINAGKQDGLTLTINDLKEPMLFCFLLLLSLLLALPYKKKRWYKTIGFGMLGMLIYIIIILKLYIIHGIAERLSGILIRDTLFAKMFSDNVGHMTIIPIFIWALVAFRRSDLKQLNIKKLNPQ